MSRRLILVFSFAVLVGCAVLVAAISETQETETRDGPEASESLSSRGTTEVARSVDDTATLPPATSPANPCSRVPPQIDPSLIPADFIPNHERINKGSGRRQGHPRWKCNPEPGLYVFLDANNGATSSFIHVAEERTKIGDLIRLGFRETRANSFAPVELPAPSRRTCDPAWRTIGFDGASLCFPADWIATEQTTFAFSTAPDILTLHPDGTVPNCGATPCPSLTVSVAAGISGIGIRDCPSPEQFTGRSGAALVCAMTGAIDERNITYGWVFDTLRYAQVSVGYTRDGARFLPDALAIVASFVEQGTGQTTSTPEEALRAHLIHGESFTDCSELPEGVLGPCFTRLGTSNGQVAYSVSANSGFSSLGIHFIRSVGPGAYVFDHIEPAFCPDSPVCPIPIDGTVSIEVRETCANVRSEPAIDGPIVTCIADGAIAVIAGPAVGRDGRVWLQIAPSLWVSASYVSCNLGCTPTDHFEPPEDYLLPGIRDWGTRHSQNP